MALLHMAPMMALTTTVDNGSNNIAPTMDPMTTAPAMPLMTTAPMMAPLTTVDNGSNNGF